MTFRNTLHALCVLALVGCGGAGAATETTPPVETTAEPQTEDTGSAEVVQTGSIDAAIAGPHRSEENRARDQYRHPKETLEFFGLQPNMTVIEMSPGGGWYTEILAPVLRDEGRLIAAIPDPERSPYGQRFVEFVESRPDIYDRVERVIFHPPEQLSLGPSNSADMVLTFRSAHGWINSGHVTQIFEAIFDVLKPGGVLGLVQHRGPEGIDPQTGYVPESTIIHLAEAAGFELEERSEINANPADDHDHPHGVWSLLPTLRDAGEDRDEWAAIGESDRMTLRFRKPAS